ncbi:MAG: hypothetical protein A9Z00_10060 [Thermobacillus sp. ZCTH02-B1]|uniref:hypothetical protein n=1 Tax=Thermobacillus sp. ZCTH02-B1 TaxID=1858795 RepID=UPI000B54D0FB|nr:hypothetical protein [Thermobacillus sp. ZCTH02-B1]OUM97399.1 MAG: hypothetical protein A9Z00_10060 [Thermobacillus sp. ZCTH02-B1]
MIHVRNNVRLLVFHLIWLALIMAAVYVLRESGVNSFHMIGWLPFVFAAGSFVIGLLLVPHPGIARNALSTLSLLVIGLMLYAICALNELALDAVYMYGLFHLPYGLLPLIESFSAANVLVIALLPYVAATLGILLKRRLVR